jgi:hypothetical protein
LIRIEKIEKGNFKVKMKLILIFSFFALIANSYSKTNYIISIEFGGDEYQSPTGMNK